MKIYGNVPISSLYLGCKLTKMSYKVSIKCQYNRFQYSHAFLYILAICMILVFININEKFRLCRKLTDKLEHYTVHRQWPYLSKKL